MAFDPCQHQITKIIINAGRIIRQLKGLPEERNITVIYQETAPLLGVPIFHVSSRDADHLPAPHEMRRPDGKQFVVPRRDCPQCGERETMFLGPLCRSCADAKDEQGNVKYRSMWQCEKCKSKERSEKVFSQWLMELNVEIPTGMKVDLGIRTFTDNGLK